MVTEFAVLVLYTQLYVSTPAGAAVALQWTDDEVAQGFAWDEDVIVFGLPDHDGECLVHVDTNPAAVASAIAEDALWAIAVPFTVVEPLISIGSIGAERQLSVAPGRYQLVFLARPSKSGYAYQLNVTFTLQAAPEFAILKQGELDSGQVLQRRAGHI